MNDAFLLSIYHLNNLTLTLTLTSLTEITVLINKAPSQGKTYSKSKFMNDAFLL